MPTARTKASNKYNQANYKQLKINVKPVDFELLDNYCKDNNIAKASFVTNAFKYCIEHDIKPQS